MRKENVLYAPAKLWILQKPPFLTLLLSALPGTVQHSNYLTYIISIRCFYVVGRSHFLFYIWSFYIDARLLYRSMLCRVASRPPI